MNRMPQGTPKAAAESTTSSASRACLRVGGWRLMTNRLFMSGSECDRTVSGLQRVDPLPQARELPGGVGIGNRAIPAIGLGLVQDTAAQRGGNADPGIKMMLCAEFSPLCADVFLFLGLDVLCRSQLHGIPINESTAY